MTALLTKADAAKILGVTPAAVAEMERAGKLPAQRTVGGVRLFRREDVEQLASIRGNRGRDQVTQRGAGS